MDFEFRAPDGERPEPVCMVARELRGGRLARAVGGRASGLRRAAVRRRAGRLVRRLLRQRRAGLLPGARLADAGAHPRPVRRVPRRHERQAGRARGPGLIGAALWHGLDAMAADEKAEMRALVLRGGPYTAGERRAILDYCRADVDTLAALLPRMLPGLLGRQRAARLSPSGTRSCGGATWRRRPAWSGPASRSTPSSSAASAAPGRHQARAGGRGRQPLRRLRRAHASGPTGSPPTWRRTASPGRGSESGALALDDDTFRDMARAYPSFSRCASSGTPWASCGSRSWRSGGTAATAACSPPSARAPAATSRATRGSSSARRPGCAA